MSKDILIIIIAVSASIVVSLITFFLNKRIKKRSYDGDEQKAILEGMRNSIEKQMYVLNDRLIQNEERWRDVNHLLLKNRFNDKKSLQLKKEETYYSNFLKENGISENDLLVDEKLIFILTPFHERFYNDYKIIQDVCSRNGYKAYRGDENYFESDIFPEMLRLITKATLIIANVNGRNPNVMYELGIAHALDKPVLLISNEPESLPIDVKSKKFLIYNSSVNLGEQLYEELSKLKQFNG